jgi:hypothetical protein
MTHDKRSESQFNYNPQDPFDGGEDPWYSWSSENQNEQGEAEEKKRTAIPYMSENAQDIENSKRSRGERL